MITKKRLELEKSDLDKDQKKQALNMLDNKELLESTENFFQAIIEVNQMLGK